MSFEASTARGGRKLKTAVGTVLGGRYRVESRLGSGGMAVVYRAEDAILGRTVALKMLHERFAEMPAFRRRFRQEARAMASLDHENIVKVYDISQDGNVPFIVAECVEGQDVGTLLSRKREGYLGEQFTRRLVAQLLRALAYAHRRGVIHRDIKPSNILVTADGTVKVADFGIARILEEDDEGDEGEIIGSARYMSPEQLKGLEATPRSDIYSVGVLLYHCLTGRPPFSGDVKKLARHHIQTEPTPPRKLNKKISPHIEAVILKALAKDPDNRYPSAYAMLDDLEVELPEPEAAHRRPKRRRARKGLVLAPLAALLFAGGGVALASGFGYVEVPSVETALGRASEVETRAPEAPDTRVIGRPAGERQQAVREMVPVPDVRTYFDYSAREILVNRGFRVRIVYGYQEGYANRGVAWGTDPAIGSLAPAGSLITVYATPKDLYQPQIR